MRRWEVFDPRDGTPMYRVPFRFLAHWLAHCVGGDYARHGDGWLTN